METSKSFEEQSHPLYSVDRDHLDRLLTKEVPLDADLVDLARLFIRYEGFPGAQDLRDDMLKTLKLWELSRDSLNEKTREIWSKGKRTGSTSSDGVGSGFDTSDESNLN